MTINRDGSFTDARKFPKRAMTDAERQAKYRRARLEAGQPEIRGIYADPSLHAQIRAFAASLQAGLQAPARADPRQHALPL